MKSLFMKASFSACICFSSSLYALEATQEEASSLNGIYSKDGQLSLILNKIAPENITNLYWNNIPILELVGDIINQGEADFYKDGEQYTLRFKNPNLISNIKSGLFKLETSNGKSYEYPNINTAITVTDKVSGNSVEINSFNGGSVITSNLTGESLEVTGNYEWMSDDDYTLLMSEKKNKSQQFRSGGFSGSFSVVNYLKTRTSYVDSSSITAQAVIYPGSYSNSVYAKLYREISYWSDYDYGEKYISSSYSKTWGGIPSNKNYYFVLRSGTSYEASGTLHVNW